MKQVVKYNKEKGYCYQEYIYDNGIEYDVIDTHRAITEQNLQRMRGFYY